MEPSICVCDWVKERGGVRYKYKMQKYNVVVCEKNFMVDGLSGGHALLQQVKVRMNKYLSPKTNGYDFSYVQRAICLGQLYSNEALEILSPPPCLKCVESLTSDSEDRLLRHLISWPLSKRSFRENKVFLNCFGFLR